MPESLFSDIIAPLLLLLIVLAPVLTSRRRAPMETALQTRNLFASRWFGYPLIALLPIGFFATSQIIWTITLAFTAAFGVSLAAHAFRMVFTKRTFD
ncbi:hypothetical protein [Salisediminibacterium selenitireducens]|uniref:Uncharacterized protein n=1 Tax=Bacillus selenitireducens (strain ATCC 700615 / DSM 15326 / MLS10) TaxID=439292 RepID=D6XWK6_BACIE|nr:hypothetical protein [Salisediminibacterium selenitireducens]ADH97848.1 hypothetical protein Bsel_0308 [[Bacillus] selenitireducens MLS10]